MRTLRLIKPWHLRPVRQRLGEMPEDTQTLSLVSHCGPAGDADSIPAIGDTVIDRLAVSNGILHSEKGPVSDFEYAPVIFR